MTLPWGRPKKSSQPFRGEALDQLYGVGVQRTSELYGHGLIASAVDFGQSHKGVVPIVSGMVRSALIPRA